MKGKLNKLDNGWMLLVDNIMYATDENAPYARLSVKNCESIDRGYDLDEEVSNIVKTIVPDDRGTDIWYGTSMAVGKLCFQKALEILGDKKFSEDDVISIIEKSRKTGLTIQYLSLAKQQTEWDVEIVEECLDKNCNGINKKGECITTGIPKLDEEGCLILKKL